MKVKWSFWPGIAILIILLASYFIKIPAESGQSYVIYTRLLSLLIFYSPIILAIYIIISLVLIFLGIKHKIKFI